MENAIVFSESELADFRAQFKRGKIFSLVNRLAGITYFLVVLVNYLGTDLSLPWLTVLQLSICFFVMFLMGLFSFMLSRAMQNLRNFTQQGDWAYFEKYAKWLLASYVLFTLEAVALIVSSIVIVFRYG